MNKILIFILLFSLFAGCSYFVKNKQEVILARVYDDYLYLSDIEGLVLENTSQQDSLVLVKNYVNNWIKSQLMLNQAQRNVLVQQLNLEQRLEDYRNSLIIYYYETELIRQQLDTVVSESEIENYYREHQSDFELKENIARVIYVMYSNGIKDKEKREIQTLFAQPDSVIMEQLEKKTGRLTQLYSVDTVKWHSFTDLQNIIPIETYNQELFLKNRRKVELSDEDYTYLLKFVNFKIQDDISPIDFERNKIRDIIINKRKMMLIQKVRNDIFNQALKNNDFEIYIKE
ncbi:MAG TPA: hypothetical protein VIN10_14720 [Bacteroidales bacterium]